MGVLLAGGLTGLMNQPSAQVIDGSLKFERTASNYLSRTFSAGNRKTFTVSFWHKHSNHSEGASVGSGGGRIFSAGTTGSGARAQMGFSGPTNGSDEDNFSIGFNATGSTWKSLNSDAFFRDFSAWQHFVIQVDCTRSTSSDRVRFYVNGVQQDLSGTFPSDENQPINSAVGHAIGRYNPEGTDYYSGLLSNFYHIDGQTLGPRYFGFTDPLTGTWRPKRLREGDTSLNDGTVWSSNSTNFTDPGQGFNGNTADYAEVSSSAAKGTFTFPKSIQVENSVTFRYNSGTSGNLFINDTAVTMQGTGAQLQTVSFSGQLNSISLQSSSQPVLYYFSVDGEVLTDSAVYAAFGTNGFYLPMENADDFEIDKSGKGNNWTKNNFSGTSIDPDVLKDSPSGAVFGGRAQTGITTTSSAPANYATLDPLFSGADKLVLSDGNLNAEATGTNGAGNWKGAVSTLGATSGKWYAEFELVAKGGSNHANIGISPITKQDTPLQSTSDGGHFYTVNGNFWNANTESTGVANEVTAGDTVGVTVDFDSSEIKWYLNGSLENTVTLNSNITSNGFVWALGNYTTSEVDCNFGQKPFKYAPPQGFLPLNSASARPETVIARPDQYFDVRNDLTAPFSVNDLNLKSDFVIAKSTSNSEYWIVADSVRGFIGGIRFNDNDDEGSGLAISNVRENGFNSDSNWFTNGRTYVTYCYKAGGNKGTFNVDDLGYASASAAGITDGTIALTGCSVGTRQGLSILKYTGSGSNGTIAHGLSQAPDFFFGRDLEDTGGSRDWIIYHKTMGNTGRLKFKGNSSISTSSTFFQDTSPTNSLITVGTSNDINSTNDYIMYCYHDVPGLQKFGGYTGNGSDDGPFIETGFRPALIWTRAYSANSDNNSHWLVYDTLTNPHNESSEVLYLNLTNNTNTHASMGIDILSNGFKLKADSSGYSNYNGWSYIYCAWAEAPAFNLFGGQSNAR